MTDILVAASVLSADLSRVADEFDRLSGSGVDVLHIDVMDGHFAPNLTFGPPVFEGVASNVPVDIHLMVERPMDYVKRFADIFNVGEFASGRNWIGIHVEVYHGDMETLKTDLVKCSELGFLTTVVVNPDTSVDFLESLLDEGLIDKVLVMTVWPGFSGQELIASCLDKVVEVKSMVGDSGVLVAVDGGINEKTIGVALEAGADFIVSGSYLVGVEGDEFRRRFGVLKGEKY